MDLAIRSRGTAAMERPAWMGQAENLRAALELYHIESEKAVNSLTGLLKAYGMDVSAGQIQGAGSEERKNRTMEVR